MPAGGEEQQRGAAGRCPDRNSPGGTNPLQGMEQIADLAGSDDEILRMTATPSVLLLHDGELDDVRALLDELGADYLHLRGGEIPERVDPPEELFIATSRRAIVADKWPPSRGTSDGHDSLGPDP